MKMSRNSRSKSPASNSASPLRPSPAVTTLWPARSSNRRTVAWTAVSSSTISIFAKRRFSRVSARIRSTAGCEFCRKPCSYATLPRWGRSAVPIGSPCPEGSVAQIFRVARANPGEFAERTRQMGAQMLLRLVGIAGIDRFRNQPVMAHDILRLAGRGQMQPAQPVDMAAAALHQRPDVLLVGGDVKLGVEFIVGGHEFFELAGLGELLLARDRSVQLGDEGLVMADREPAHDFQFNRLAQEMRLLRQSHIDPADHSRVLREHV